jgi:hypothetical protein
MATAGASLPCMQYVPYVYKLKTKQVANTVSTRPWITTHTDYTYVVQLLRHYTTPQHAWRNEVKINKLSNVFPLANENRSNTCCVSFGETRTPGVFTLPAAAFYVFVGNLLQL